MDLSAWKHEILKGEQDGVKNLFERRRFNNVVMLRGGESWFNVTFNGVTITVNFEPSDTPEEVKRVIRDKFWENDVELSDYFDLEREDTGERLTQEAIYMWKELNLRVVEASSASSSSIGGESKSSGRRKHPSPYEYVREFNERIHEYEQRIAKLKHQRHRQELQEIRRAVRNLSTFEREFAEKRQHPVFMVGNWSNAAIARWCTGSKGTKNKLKSPDPDWDWLRRHNLKKIRYKSRALFAKFCASQALPSVRDQGHKTIISDLKRQLQSEDQNKMDKQIKNFEIPNMGGEIRVLVIERLRKHNNPKRLKKQELDDARNSLIRCHDGIVLGEDHMDDAILSAKRHLKKFHELAKDVVSYADTQSLEMEEGPKQKMLGALLYLGYYGKALEEHLESLKNIQKGSNNSRHQIDIKLRNIRRALEQVNEKTQQQDIARNRRLSEMYHPQEAGWKEVKGASRSPAASDRGGESKKSASRFVFRTHSYDSGDEEPIGDMGVAEQLARLSVEDESGSSNKKDADKCRGCDKNPSGDQPYCKPCTDILKRLGVPPNETDEHYVRGIMRIFSLKGKKRKSGKKKKGSQKKNQKNQKKLVCDVDWSRMITTSFAKWLWISIVKNWSSRNANVNANVIELIIKSIQRGDKMWTYIVGNDVSKSDLISWLREIDNFPSWTPNMCMYYAALFKKDMDKAVGAAIREGEGAGEDGKGGSISLYMGGEDEGDKREIWFERAWKLMEHFENWVKVRMLERIIEASRNPYHLYIWRTRLFEVQKDDEHFNLENAQELEKMLQDLILHNPDNRSYPFQRRVVLGSILPRVIGDEWADITDIVEIHFKILDADLDTMFDDELTQRYEGTVELIADVVDNIDDEHSKWINTKKLELYRMKWKIKTGTGDDTIRQLEELMKESIEKHVTLQVEEYGTLARLAQETLGDAYFNSYEYMFRVLPVAHTKYDRERKKMSMLDYDTLHVLKPLLQRARQAYSEAGTYKGQIGMEKCDRELKKFE